MKSTDEALKRRGLASEDDKKELSACSYTELTKALHSPAAHIRSAAAYHLRKSADRAADELLRQLVKEKCLYTRIAICECLECGGLETAKKMTGFLGRIGNNQHRILPDKVSAKKSFPLPRDLMARSLGKMDPVVFPALLDVITGNEVMKIREVLDAYGFMVFYHTPLSTPDHCRYILTLPSRFPCDEILLWKSILCLSAFSCKESMDFLSQYAEEDTLFGQEARRSLALAGNRRRIF